MSYDSAGQREEQAAIRLPKANACLLCSNMGSIPRLDEGRAIRRILA